ncbi:unnamed protein product [Callosobruchus maculatus]|uniref:Odorant receptor n=1 Tax=Callosobruchus maculatus TaxID=64391 RepID=A0A653BJZ4_CALMS|nr:unnamed protein product [Callosobruchus maculatus]
MLQDKQYHYERCGNFSPGKIVSKSKRFCHRYTIVTYLLYYMVGGSAHISALWHLNSDQKGETFTANVTCYDFMPYFFIIPFSTETTTGCKNALIMMDAGLGIMAFYIASYDALFCSLLICLKTKLQILCEATKAIRERVVMKLDLPQHYRIFKDELNREFEAEMYAEIRRINFHLESLLSVCIDIEALFSYTTLIQTMTSLVVLASCLFVASLVPYTDPEFYSLIEYSLAILCQLLMICYFGNLITEVSLSYRYSLYECDWYSSSQRFKQAILIMMCRIEKPLYLTIGKFSPLTLNTFVSVVKASFSYAAVFRTVD